MKIHVTGHRPPKIPWGSKDPLRLALRSEMRKLIVQLQPEICITGMAIGVDQDFALECVALGFPFLAAVPFEGQEQRWPAAAQREYHELLQLAAQVVYVSEPGYENWKMNKRNKWMSDEVGDSGAVIAVWDGSDGGTSNCVKYAESIERAIYRIDPDVVANNL
jgi:uncharacterized phage-like protein YoqJ